MKEETSFIKRFIEDWLNSPDCRDKETVMAIMKEMHVNLDTPSKEFIDFLATDVPQIKKYFEYQKVRKARVDRMAVYRNELGIKYTDLAKVLNTHPDSISHAVSSERCAGTKKQLAQMFSDPLLNYRSDLELEVKGLSPHTSIELLKEKFKKNESQKALENSVESKKSELESKKDPVPTLLPTGFRGGPGTIPGKQEYYDAFDAMPNTIGIAKSEIMRCAGITNTGFDTPNARMKATFPIQKLYDFSGSEVFLDNDVVQKNPKAGSMMKALVAGEIFPPPVGTLADPLDEKTWTKKGDDINLKITKKIHELTHKFGPTELSKKLSLDPSLLHNFLKKSRISKLFPSTMQKFYDFTGDEVFLIEGVKKHENAEKDSVKAEPVKEVPKETEVPPVSVYQRMQKYAKHPLAVELYSKRKEVLTGKMKGSVPPMNIHQIAEKMHVDPAALQTAYMKVEFNDAFLNKKLFHHTQNTIFLSSNDEAVLQAILGEEKLKEPAEAVNVLRVPPQIETSTVEIQKEEEPSVETVEASSDLVVEQKEEAPPPVGEEISELPEEELLPELTDDIIYDETPPSETFLSDESTSDEQKILSELDMSESALQEEIQKLEEKKKRIQRERIQLQQIAELKKILQNRQLLLEQKDITLKEQAQKLAAYELQVDALKREIASGSTREYVTLPEGYIIPKEFLKLYPEAAIKQMLEKKLYTKEDIRKMAQSGRDVLTILEKLLRNMLPSLSGDLELRKQAYQIMDVGIDSFFNHWRQFISVSGHKDPIIMELKADEKMGEILGRK